MPFFLKPVGVGVLLSVLLLGCSKQEKEVPQPEPVPAVTSLTLTTLTPTAGATLTRASTLTAQLAYSLAATETSPYGYRVAIQFAKVNSTTTTAINPSSINLTERTGTVTLQYPLELIWDRTNLALAHPITCYYYLQRVNATNSTVIAKTAAQSFTE